MHIALVLPGSIWFAPYVRIYTRILDKENVQYSIVSWNREGDDKPEGYQYNVRCKNGHLSASMSDYLGYIRFVQRTLKKHAFDKVIVFGPQMTCLLSLFLLTHYRGRFMLDYRDLSIEQKPFFKQLFALMLKFSCANVISSPGFQRCLPKRKYYLSHNFDESEVRRAIGTPHAESAFNVPNGRIDVLTIGAIRDFSSNIEVTKALVNKENCILRFVGRGNDAVERLKSYCDEVSAVNVKFVGAYDKPEEVGFVENSTFLNIFYPRLITHDTALSNRFYNSLIYKRPMIVTKDTTQGDFAEKYGVGIAVSDCNNLYQELKSFLNVDYNEYAQKCNDLLRSFLKDQEEFVAAVLNFVRS